MIIFLYSIAAAAVLIYLPFLVVAYARARIGYEMFSTPRAMFEKLPPYAQRATWAHQNTFEAFMYGVCSSGLDGIRNWCKFFYSTSGCDRLCGGPFAILNFLYFEYTPFAIADVWHWHPWLCHSHLLEHHPSY